MTTPRILTWQHDLTTATKLFDIQLLACHWHLHLAKPVRVNPSRSFTDVARPATPREIRAITRLGPGRSAKNGAQKTTGQRVLRLLHVRTIGYHFRSYSQQRMLKNPYNEHPPRRRLASKPQDTAPHGPGPAHTGTGGSICLAGVGKCCIWTFVRVRLTCQVWRKLATGGNVDLRGRRGEAHALGRFLVAGVGNRVRAWPCARIRLCARACTGVPWGLLGSASSRWRRVLGLLTRAWSAIVRKCIRNPMPATRNGCPIT